MKKYQRLSTNILERERSLLEYDIAVWEDTLSKTQSALIVRYLTHAIKQAKEKIHAIEAELLYREHQQ